MWLCFEDSRARVCGRERDGERGARVVVHALVEDGRVLEAAPHGVVFQRELRKLANRPPPPTRLGMDTHVSRVCGLTVSRRPLASAGGPRDMTWLGGHLKPPSAS